MPKTIDNDLAATDQTFGFDTAVSIATEAIDRLHTTAESHDRVMVVEVMGRHAGWLAVQSGIAGGADVVLIPEFPITVERCADMVRARHTRGRDFSIVVVSEGWPLTREAGSEGLSTQTAELDAFGHVRLGGVGDRLAEELERLTGFDTRVTVLGHLQRGGSPTAYDRVLATRYGLLAADLARQRPARPDDRPARHRGDPRPARRRREGAEDGAPRVLRAGGGLLRLGQSGRQRCDGGGAPPSGSVTRNVAPAPGALSTATAPPWASTIAATIARPSPEPPWSREREGSPR